LPERDQQDLANALLKDAVALTPWAVEFRYADPFAPVPLDRREALATVVAVRAWAARAMVTEKAAEQQPDSPSDTKRQV